jgi:hypothetical protein
VGAVTDFATSQRKEGIGGQNSGRPLPKSAASAVDSLRQLREIVNELI